MTNENDYDDVPDEDIDFGMAPRHADISGFKTEFERWHHPRKQYVRVQQWCAASRRLIRDLALPSSEPFRYLTLPGNEMLDVRALTDVCAREGVKLRFLGFNSVGSGSREQLELNISQNEVRSHQSIDSFSQVLQRRLETVTNGKSQEFRATRDAGPFHAINIDLCDSIAFRDNDDRRGSGLGVIAKLLELQLATTRPWLLFITTLAQPDLVSGKNRSGFMDAIAANNAVSHEFKAELAGLISTTADQLEERLQHAWQHRGPNFLRLFCAGLGKWLLRVLGASQPSRSLTLLDSCYYRVGSEGPNMLSLVFRCDTQRQQLVDRHGILPAAPDQESFSEVQLAIAMAKKLAESSDLDELLRCDNELADRLIRQAGKLMASARFDADAYETWAKGELAKFSSVASSTTAVPA